ncbi:MAG: hypothetical protein WCZ02_11670, partial [Lysobacterales bacterium]
ILDSRHQENRRPEIGTQGSQQSCNGKDRDRQIRSQAGDWRNGEKNRRDYNEDRSGKEGRRQENCTEHHRRQRENCRQACGRLPHRQT